MPSHKPQAVINSAELTGKWALFKNGEGANPLEISGIISISKQKTDLYGGHVTGADAFSSTLSINASHSHTVQVENIGSDGPHNNVQPYTVAHIWQRVS